MGYAVRPSLASTEKLTAKYELSESTKIRDLKFSPHRPWQLAVQSSTKLEILDLRKGMDIMATYEIVSNELHGIGVKWDPVNPHRLASAISKEISVFDISSGQFEKVDSVSHYSLIKSFHWMRTKPSFFGIMCDKPEKYIVFYDLEDRNRLAYYYGGHQRPMDCWIMNEEETVLVSASNHREKAKQGLGTNLNSTFLVAQRSSNCLDPNEAKFNHPITFNNDSELAFCLNITEDHKDPKKKSSSHELRSKQRPIQTTPAVYHFRDRVEWFEREREILFPLSFKEEVVYLAKNYLVEGDNHKLTLNNAEVALRIGKSHCAEMWKNLLQICFPEKEEPTV